MMEDFEKDIKDFFQRREIRPSADAWQRMEHLLSEPQAKPKKAYRIYWAVVASVVVLFGLFTLLQKQDKELIEPASNNVYVSKDSVVNRIQQPQNTNQVVKANVVPQKTENIKKQATTIKNIPEKISEKINKEVYVVQQNKPKEDVFPVEKMVSNEIASTQNTKTQIYVNPNKLLQSAEMERQTDNMISNGQNFWKKIKEINTVVVHSK